MSIGQSHVSVAVCVAERAPIVQGVFEYGGQTYDLMPHPEGASASGCAKLVKLVLKQNEPCGAEQVIIILIMIIYRRSSESFLALNRCVLL